MLEATMMIIDNSEYMRNGDYTPTRFEAQSDAITTVFQTKIDSNPENTVGVMSMAGKAPEVLVTHTKEIGHVLQAIHTSSQKIGGSIDIPTAIAVAQLALKHRENKNLRQRIIVFVASPLEGQAADQAAMIKLGKKLKKNNVAVDIVAFGDGIEESAIPGEEPKNVLKTFVDTVNSGDNSHMLSVPPSIGLLSDAIISSPVLSGDRSASIPEGLGGDAGAGAAGGSSSANDFEFGVDPSLDPELAMALRLSMQEAQAREQQQQPPPQEASSSSSAAPPSTTDTQSASASKPKAGTDTIPADPTDDEEEAMLQQALAMSTDQDQDVDMDGGHDTAMDDEDDDEDEDAAIQRAIAMSMQDQNEDTNPKDSKK